MTGQEAMVGFRAGDPRAVLVAFTEPCSECGHAIAYAASAREVLARGAIAVCIDCFRGALAAGDVAAVAAPSPAQLAEISAYLRRN